MSDTPTLPKEPQVADWPSAPCSPSSDTPETDRKAHFMPTGPNQWLAVVDADVCEEMERQRNAARAMAGIWYNIHERQPEQGQIVTLYMSHRQMRQAVCDKGYSGGFKMPNCAGWECVGQHWGWMWSPCYVPPPSPEESKWREINSVNVRSAGTARDGKETES